MSDPIRLREEGSAATRSLLDSAKVDAPHEGAEARALVALGLTVAASTAPAAATTTKSWAALHLATIVKIIGVLIVLGIVAIATKSTRTSTPTPTSATTATATPSATSIPSATPSAATSTSPSLASSSPISPSPSISSSSAPKKPAVAKPFAEVEWIDRAQAALAHDPARALSIVDEYRAQPGPHAFDEEASAIAAEAAQRSGDHARAEREAKAFLAKYPSSAYADRVRAVLADP